LSGAAIDRVNPFSSFLHLVVDFRNLRVDPSFRAGDFGANKLFGSASRKGQHPHEDEHSEN
jgi:hypothetical protein